MIIIPINNDPNQTFTITIPVGEINVILTFYVFWNAMAGYWEMNVSQGETELIFGLPLVTGAGGAMNLLEQFAYLNIGTAYILSLGTTTNDSPIVGDWGTNFVMLWGDE